MLHVLKKPSSKLKKPVISFDLEWTKNYRIKNGSQPFCYSFVLLDAARTLPNVPIRFAVFASYIQCKEETSDLIAHADTTLGQLLQDYPDAAIVGHQLSSDISVILNHESGQNSPHFSKIREAWHTRRQSLFATPIVFDTRYDLEGFLTGPSRRLVDVCEECNLLVMQPEIAASMTKMQNDYLLSQDSTIYEKLMTLNIRHSLSAALLYSFFLSGHLRTHSLNVNQTLFANLRHELGYIRSDPFRALL